jgi:ANTAR domain-containing protein
VELLGVSGAAVALILAGDGPSSLAASDPLAELIVDLQCTLGEGPSIDAYGSGRPVLVGELAAGTRWPAFAPEAIAAGAVAVFALPLQVGAARFGAFTLYRDRAGPLGPSALADALAIGELACEITLCLQADVPPGSLAQVVDDVVAQRTVIYQATGMVLAQLGISPEAALATLRARAYADGRPLADVSADVVARRLQFDP